MSAATCRWTASSTSPIDGYNVYYRKEGVATFTKANPSVITGTSFTITNLEPGTYFAYALSVRGNELSDPSNRVSFTIEFGNLYKPKNLQSSVVSGDATLTWDYVPGITSYEVYLDSGAGFVSQGTVYDNDIEIAGLSAGSYDWYVASLYEGSEVESETASFTV